MGSRVQKDDHTSLHVRLIGTDNSLGLFSHFGIIRISRQAYQYSARRLQFQNAVIVRCCNDNTPSLYIRDKLPFALCLLGRGLDYTNPWLFGIHNQCNKSILIEPQGRRLFNPDTDDGSCLIRPGELIYFQISMPASFQKDLLPCSFYEDILENMDEYQNEYEIFDESVCNTLHHNERILSRDPVVYDDLIVNLKEGEKISLSLLHGGMIITKFATPTVVEFEDEVFFKFNKTFVFTIVNFYPEVAPVLDIPEWDKKRSRTLGDGEEENGKTRFKPDRITTSDIYKLRVRSKVNGPNSLIREWKPMGSKAYLTELLQEAGIPCIVDSGAGMKERLKLAGGKLSNYTIVVILYANETIRWDDAKHQIFRTSILLYSTYDLCRLYGVLPPQLLTMQEILLDDKEQTFVIDVDWALEAGVHFETETDNFRDSLDFVIKTFRTSLVRDFNLSEQGLKRTFYLFNANRKKLSAHVHIGIKMRNRSQLLGWFAYLRLQIYHARMDIKDSRLARLIDLFVKHLDNSIYDKDRCMRMYGCAKAKSCFNAGKAFAEGRPLRASNRGTAMTLPLRFAFLRLIEPDETFPFLELTRPQLDQINNDLQRDQLALETFYSPVQLNPMAPDYNSLIAHLHLGPIEELNPTTQLTKNTFSFVDGFISGSPPPVNGIRCPKETIRYYEPFVLQVLESYANTNGIRATLRGTKAINPKFANGNGYKRICLFLCDLEKQIGTNKQRWCPSACHRAKGAFQSFIDVCSDGFLRINCVTANKPSCNRETPCLCWDCVSLGKPCPLHDLNSSTSSEIVEYMRDRIMNPNTPIYILPDMTTTPSPNDTPIHFADQPDSIPPPPPMIMDDTPRNPVGIKEVNSNWLEHSFTQRGYSINHFAVEANEEGGYPRLEGDYLAVPKFKNEVWDECFQTESDLNLPIIFHRFRETVYIHIMGTLYNPETMLGRIRYRRPIELDLERLGAYCITDIHDIICVCEASIETNDSYVCGVWGGKGTPRSKCRRRKRTLFIQFNTLDTAVCCLECMQFGLSSCYKDLPNWPEDRERGPFFKDWIQMNKSGLNFNKIAPDGYSAFHKDDSHFYRVLDQMPNIFGSPAKTKGVCSNIIPPIRPAFASPAQTYDFLDDLVRSTRPGKETWAGYTTEDRFRVIKVLHGEYLGTHLHYFRRDPKDLAESVTNALRCHENDPNFDNVKLTTIDVGGMGSGKTYSLTKLVLLTRQIHRSIQLRDIINDLPLHRQTMFQEYLNARTEDWTTTEEERRELIRLIKEHVDPNYTTRELTEFYICYRILQMILISDPKSGVPGVKNASARGLAVKNGYALPTKQALVFNSIDKKMDNTDPRVRRVLTDQVGIYDEVGSLVSYFIASILKDKAPYNIFISLRLAKHQKISHFLDGNVTPSSLMYIRHARDIPVADDEDPRSLINAPNLRVTTTSLRQVKKQVTIIDILSELSPRMDFHEEDDYRTSGDVDSAVRKCNSSFAFIRWIFFTYTPPASLAMISEAMIAFANNGNPFCLAFIDRFQRLNDTSREFNLVTRALVFDITELGEQRNLRKLHRLAESILVLLWSVIHNGFKVSEIATEILYWFQNANDLYLNFEGMEGDMIIPQLLELSNRMYKSILVQDCLVPGTGVLPKQMPIGNQIINSLEELLEMVVIDLEEYRNLYIAFCHKKTLLGFHNMLRTRFRSIAANESFPKTRRDRANYLLENDRLHVFHADCSQTQKLTEMRDLNKIWVTKCAVLVTAVIPAGLSFDVDNHFQRIYASLASEHGPDAAAIQQLTSRVRLHTYGMRSFFFEHRMFSNRSSTATLEERVEMPQRFLSLKLQPVHQFIANFESGQTRLLLPGPLQQIRAMNRVGENGELLSFIQFEVMNKPVQQVYILSTLEDDESRRNCVNSFIQQGDPGIPTFVDCLEPNLTEKNKTNKVENEHQGQCINNSILIGRAILPDNARDLTVFAFNSERSDGFLDEEERRRYDNEILLVNEYEFKRHEIEHLYNINLPLADKLFLNYDTRIPCCPPTLNGVVVTKADRIKIALLGDLAHFKLIEKFLIIFSFTVKELYLLCDKAQFETYDDNFANSHITNKYVKGAGAFSTAAFSDRRALVLCGLYFMGCFHELGVPQLQHYSIQHQIGIIVKSIEDRFPNIPAFLLAFFGPQSFQRTRNVVNSSCIKVRTSITKCLGQRRTFAAWELGSNIVHLLQNSSDVSIIDPPILRTTEEDHYDHFMLPALAHALEDQVGVFFALHENQRVCKLELPTCLPNCTIRKTTSCYAERRHMRRIFHLSRLLLRKPDRSTYLNVILTNNPARMEKCANDWDLIYSRSTKMIERQVMVPGEIENRSLYDTICSDFQGLPARVGDPVCAVKFDFGFDPYSAMLADRVFQEGEEISAFEGGRKEIDDFLSYNYTIEGAGLEGRMKSTRVASVAKITERERKLKQEFHHRAKFVCFNFTRNQISLEEIWRAALTPQALEVRRTQLGRRLFSTLNIGWALRDEPIPNIPRLKPYMVNKIMFPRIETGGGDIPAPGVAPILAEQGINEEVIREDEEMGNLDDLDVLLENHPGIENIIPEPLIVTPPPSPTRNRSYATARLLSCLQSPSRQSPRREAQLLLANPTTVPSGYVPNTGTFPVPPCPRREDTWADYGI